MKAHSRRRDARGFLAIAISLAIATGGLTSSSPPLRASHGQSAETMVSPRHSASGPTYLVTFTENGLPSGTEWFVNITGGNSFSSATTTSAFDSPNGTYDYKIGSANTRWDSASGVIMVSGAPLSELVSFSQVTYPITFSVTGLVVGSSWTVTLDGIPQIAWLLPTGPIHFREPNGTYSFEIGPEEGMRASPAHGSVVVL